MGRSILFVLMLGISLHLLTKEILILKANQKFILQNQEEILNKFCANTVYHQNLFELQPIELPVKLPINSSEDLQKIESSLKDEAIKDCLILRLSDCGGHTVDSTVKRIVKKLMTDFIAQNYSWLGAKGKEVFSSLGLCEIVFAAARKNPSLIGPATDADIELAIKNWLRHAKARCSKHICIQENSQSLV